MRLQCPINVCNPQRDAAPGDRVAFLRALTGDVAVGSQKPPDRGGFKGISRRMLCGRIHA
jgi:hypothetical protein